MISVYVIRSLKDNGYYIGISNNIDNRIKKHNSGGVYSTKDRRPFELIYTEEFKTYSLARFREKEIKSYKGGNKFKKLIQCRVV